MSTTQSPLKEGGAVETLSGLALPPPIVRSASTTSDLQRLLESPDVDLADATKQLQEASVEELEKPLDDADAERAQFLQLAADYKKANNDEMSSCYKKLAEGTSTKRTTPPEPESRALVKKRVHFASPPVSGVVHSKTMTFIELVQFNGSNWRIEYRDEDGRVELLTAMTSHTKCTAMTTRLWSFVRVDSEGFAPVSRMAD